MSRTRDESVTRRIAELNDQLRTRGNETYGGAVNISMKLWHLGSEFCSQAITTMKEFADFDSSKHAEHDFGEFEVDGRRVCFKVDYYTLDMQGESKDPADPAKTMRILTLMLADQWMEGRPLPRRYPKPKSH